MKVVPSAAAELIKELEALAKPLLAAIATARRLPEIAVPTSEDGRIGAGLFSMAHGFNKANRAPIDSIEKFARIFPASKHRCKSSRIACLGISAKGFDDDGARFSFRVQVPRD